MKGLSKHLIAGAALLTTVGVTQAEFSGEISLTSDYRFRGITQTDRAPAVQGGIEYGHESGFYAGVWGSSIGFTDGGIEFDPYMGFGGETAAGVEYDLGAVYFYYPKDGLGAGDPSLDFWEFYGSLGLAGATVGVIYSPDYFAETGRYFYLHGSYDVELPEGFGLSFHLGANMFKNSDNLDDFLEIAGTGQSAGSTYLDWSIALTKEAYGLDWSLAYVDTDLSKSECFGGDNGCGATAVLSVTKSL